jgi:hypothetical protein
VVEVVHVPRLGQKALHLLAVVDEVRLEPLESDFQPGDRVGGEKDVAHAPVADGADEGEAVDGQRWVGPFACRGRGIAGQGLCRLSGVIGGNRREAWFYRFHKTSSRRRVHA